MIAQWRTQPEHMIEKCAEAHALRRAFPHDLGGMYLEEETPAPAPSQRPSRPARTVTEAIEEAPAPVRGMKAAHERLTALLGQLQLGTPEDEKALIDWVTGRGEGEALTRAQVATVTSFLEDALKAADGEPELAFTQIWTQYRAASPEPA
jgi:hypothetical protein